LAQVLILPGLGNSGTDHWQSHWERKLPGARRVEQDEWDSPDRRSWVRRLDDVMHGLAERVVFVAHSSSCALVAHWTRQADPAAIDRVVGAFLVAPSDPLGPHYPTGPSNFAPVPHDRLPFKTIVVASDDDPYVSLDRAREYADAWGSELVILNNAGHINVAAGFGPWPEGLDLLTSLSA
jgi:uncharacterized protein